MENQEFEINLTDIFEMFKKHIKLIVIVPILVGIITLIINSFFITPIYEAKGNVLVNRPSDVTDVNTFNPNDVTDYQKLVSTYAELAKLDIVYETAGENLNLDSSTINELASTISINPKGSTQILTASVKSDNPELAQHYVSELIMVLKEVGEEKKGQDNIQLLDLPKMPSSPISPNKIMNTLKSVICSIILIIGYVLLIEFMDKRIKKVNEVEKLLDLPVIGIVPDTKGGKK